MVFDDGFEVSMEIRDSNLRFHYYDSQAYQISSRMLRGGSWGGDAEDSDANIGFRVALSARDDLPARV